MSQIENVNNIETLDVIWKCCWHTSLYVIFRSEINQPKHSLCYQRRLDLKLFQIHFVGWCNVHRGNLFQLMADFDVAIGVDFAGYAKFLNGFQSIQDYCGAPIFLDTLKNISLMPIASHQLEHSSLDLFCVDPFCHKNHSNVSFYPMPKE